MPAKGATKRTMAAAAGPSSLAQEYASSPASTSSMPLTPADQHLLGYVNNMRKCCDMTMFYSNLSEQGSDFITDSLIHATQIFATYATSSKEVASPSKLAAELLRSPTRTRTRSKATTTRSRVAANNTDPFSDCIDITDKENAPFPTRSKSSKAVSYNPFNETSQGTTKQRKEDVVRPARAALVDVSVENDVPEPSKKPKTKSRMQNSQDDSMADDVGSADSNKAEDQVPRASTPPPKTATPLKETAAVIDLDAVSIFESDDEDDSLVEQLTGGQDSMAPAQATQNDVTFASSVGDKTQASDVTTSSSRLDSAQTSAAALLASKLAQQKDTSVDKPVKRTLASYGAAKKSLPATAHQARASVTTTTLHPASTPAGPGFRSSFLNKSLRKQIVDHQALESDDDSDSDEDSDDQVEEPTRASYPKSSATATLANTRANATIVSQPAKKRKSDDEVTTTATATTSTAFSDLSLRSPRIVNKAPKLGGQTTTAKSSANVVAAAKKSQPVVGPASKLEQFRNNLAHVTRSSDNSTSSSANTSAQSTASTSVVATTAPTSPTTRASAKAAARAATTLPFALPGVETVSSDSSAEMTEKVTAGNRSGESTIKASAIPRSPVASPSRAGAKSPLRPPTRAESVRTSPRKLTEQVEKPPPIVRAASPTRTRAGNNPFQRAITSPPPQTRSIAALFNSPKQSSKLPTLTAAPVSTTPTHSPPKALQLAKVPFPTSKAKDTNAQAKPLPQAPAAKEATRVASAASVASRDAAFFDAEPDAFFDAVDVNDIKVVAPAPTSSVSAKPAPVSPKKATTGKTAKIVPASPSKTPSKTGTLRNLTTSPGKSKTPAGATSPSRAWGLGDKIKGFLGFNPAAAQNKISASNAFQPKQRDAATGDDTRQATVATVQLLASPVASSKANVAVQSTPNSLVGGKPASLARAELLRRKQAEEEERKAKEKEERRKMLLAKKEERAKAVAEEENEKESKKRARDINERGGTRTADQSAASLVIPAVLLTGSSTSTSGNASVSRISTVSSASSTSAPTRPSSAMNGSYSGVKSRYMQPTSINAPSMHQPVDSNKKRRITAEREPTAAPVVAQQVKPAAVPASVAGAPKLVRTVSQASIRPPHTAQPSQPQQIKLTSVKPVVPSSSASQRIPTAVNGGNALSKTPASTAQPTRPMANVNFSSANPFQQAKQQQLHLAQQQQQQQFLQKQKQHQLQQQQNAAAAAAAAAQLREQELHRAAQKQFHAQQHQYEYGDVVQESDEPLPDIASEYSDSEDEETIQKRAAMPSWTQGEALDAALLAQSTVDADEIFGIPHGPVELEKILPGERTANRIRRPRSSSANWSGQDGLAQWEIDRYNKRMGIKGVGVQIPGPPLARMSMAANRPSTSSAPYHPSNLSHSTTPGQTHTPAQIRKFA